MSSQRPCYGVACAPRAQCARYRAVETSELTPIDSCESSDHRRPLFVLWPAKPVAAGRDDPPDGEGEID